ncbi:MULTISPECIES: three component ABC system middle component [Paenibacillus]|uniref:Uncharacterized protein n=1 Tax=Paenibacillus macerans TaxID=44252 RepID=A0A090ZEH4_PAEMA|nr:three component ABC system middle component [Paenibacillus macerans]KFN09724.1 hypothetical protein DJ90_3524 [Paenibacillus macerans]MCY7559761.1 DUF6521 family protein [Paenibacillus macerans]MEC0151170.1 DUF6521 family protein [Paenibacillus macerans]OMG51007.1 hypothetical protein BK140_03780 [Paenibacillus macerans]SUA82313.1 Uncharacterised protein [Paenibacillus macerans]
MDHLDEYDIIQNVALASLVIWSFSAKYYTTNEEKRGIDLQVLMLILPLLFNESFVNSAYRRNFKKGFFAVLNDNKSTYIGLQERMENMSKLTLRSINACISSKLLMYDTETYSFVPIRTIIPKFNESEDIKKIFAASERLGYWFATIDFQEICTLLKVRF